MIVARLAYLKYGNVLRAIIILSLCTSCGLPKQGRVPLDEPLPLSNEQVREKILVQAMETFAVPDGMGSEISCSVVGENQKDDLMKIIATEFLLSHGYRIMINNPSLPEFRVSVDTLYVTLTPGTSYGKGKRTYRFAETHIKADFLNPDGTRQVYHGHGSYEDSFNARYLDSLDLHKPYVITSSRSGQIKTKIKPFFVGFTLSLLAWILYSYRG